MYDQVVKCQRAGLCLSEHFLIKTVATRRQILRLYAPKYKIRLGLRPRPRWGSLQRSPAPLAGFKGPTSKEIGEGVEETGREVKGRECCGVQKILKIDPAWCLHNLERTMAII